MLDARFGARFCLDVKMIVAAVLMLAGAPTQVFRYGCRMAECSWFKEVARSTVLTNPDGELVRYVTLNGISSHPNDRYPARYSSALGVRWVRSASYVFCSRTRPGVAFLDRNDPTRPRWLAHMLDLYNLYGYNSSSAVAYLRACHQITLNGRPIKQVLRRLGYDAGTPSGQIELKMPADLANPVLVTRGLRDAGN